MKNESDAWREEWTSCVTACDFVIKIKSDKYNANSHHQHSSAEEAYINDALKPYVSVSIRKADRGKDSYMAGQSKQVVVDFLEKRPACSSRKRRELGLTMTGATSYDQLGKEGKDSYNKLVKAQKVKARAPFT